MTTIEDRAEELLRSPLGCAFLLVAEASGLSAEQAADPPITLYLTAAALFETTPWRGNHGLVVREVLSRARSCAGLARAILQQPTAEWWSAPLNRAHQVWISQEGDAPGPESLVTPNSPPTEWERYAQKPAQWFYTSTLLRGTTSIFSAVDRGASDLHYGYPSACWVLQAPESARILEINGPAAWHQLCSRYSAVAKDGRLVPDWSLVAGDWDAVHLTLGGLLTCQQVRVESEAGWTEHWAWDAESTLWLHWVFTGSERLPDHYRESSAFEPTRLRF